MPPVRLRQRTADQPGVGDLTRQLSLVGPRPDRLGQIHIGIRVRRHRPRDPRQRLHQVLLVGGGEQPIRRRRELAHHQPTARPRHPRHLAQPRGVVDDVAQPEADGHRVEHPVGERQPRRVARDLRHRARPAPAASMPTEKSAATHHAPDAASSTVDTAVPAARSSTLSPGPMSQRRAGGAPPEPVLPQRQHGVGQVVAARDGVEHRRHLTWVFVQRRAVHARDGTCELLGGNGQRR